MKQIRIKKAAVLGAVVYLTTKLVHEMQRRKAKLELVTMCSGGGMGAAGIFELQ